MSYLDRILDNGADRDEWLTSRRTVIGASDAAKLVKPESLEKYVAAKLKETSFSGNKFTESGDVWEPRLLSWGAIPQNRHLIHSPDEPGFAATPDGLKVTPEGIVLAEVKAKHNRIVFGPTPAEIRQVAWQQFCVGPEVLYTDFIWGEIVNDQLRDLEPKRLRIYPGEMTEILAGILTIAVPMLVRLRRARAFEMELLAS
ncbi:hypothetical protein B7R22_16970 [Subtercola boreus]|uniref:YqaJ viral recombinase domain-containing protein n=1 Tax=Subtercola boreus TaxID=120213 RepID=A0A3E0VRV0_9MICO|nr:hypothetical protein [Subtercola boreus]RFA12123.1 hypothetical protein B7R22_16970 [Subtercola boreus]